MFVIPGISKVISRESRLLCISLHFTFCIAHTISIHFLCPNNQDMKPERDNFDPLEMQMNDNSKIKLCFGYQQLPLDACIPAYINLPDSSELRLPRSKR